MSEIHIEDPENDLCGLLQRRGRSFPCSNNAAKTDETHLADETIQTVLRSLKEILLESGSISMVLIPLPCLYEQ
ncbi:hypothetical protein O9G_002589 [Rozella allomycis CSF55]|uniref:Uncharacterized protein n=1 Tax=Rozella allomycis (strain CSF55) TaxID=988480 RepID=A0A075AU44_ROZAC|nr:hypothetical protein O9G_002589 [Rozella allomycis CSF55]|eukprot:EPZ32237.1 hypothetical protein O9G_002589 [Rozella allomycis CSF55]